MRASQSVCVQVTAAQLPTPYPSSLLLVGFLLLLLPPTPTPYLLLLPTPYPYSLLLVGFLSSLGGISLTYAAFSFSSLIALTLATTL